MYRKLRRRHIFLFLLVVSLIIFVIRPLGLSWKWTVPKVRYELEETVISSRVLVIGMDFRTAGLRTLRHFHYVLLLPHALERAKLLSTMEGLSDRDRESLVKMARFLHMSFDHNAVSCLAKPVLPQYPPVRLRGYAYSDERPCNYEVKNMTILIGDKTETTSKQTVDGSQDLVYKECNIADGAIMIRRETLYKIGLDNSYGETTMLDLYLRARGRLKIAGLMECSMSSELSRLDRGMANGNATFLDYVTLGAAHNVTRIVRDNSITWVKCSLTPSLCPERPLAPLSDRVLPVCCSRLLDRLLVDTVSGLGQVGVDYRIEYGTLLGGVRSGAIIPWTKDIDIGLRERDYFNDKVFYKLQRLMKPKGYLLPIIKGQRRVIPLFPPFVPMKMNPFDEQYQFRLFNSDVIAAMKKLLPLKAIWTNLGYGDFYIAKEERFRSLAAVTINGNIYSTFTNANKALAQWYGQQFMSPKMRISAPNEINIVEARKKRRARAKKARKAHRKRKTRRKKRRRDTNRN
ncbi:uncharacterized protein LOC125568069 [Nematostella vectensis]|uniref:uncharacterized protein LOC125568069 n=1 Tax=Nematostella vectensis TaxID=45351 RepID=UPI00207725EE|nr:uncharacterized protein LOC125568069 [Nematostella vectensis]